MKGKLEDIEMSQKVKQFLRASKAMTYENIEEVDFDKELGKLEIESKINLFPMRHNTM